ncbi:hypothetical protein CROQUDRAFT_651354 [Cronartium quercuum f. sp. fusiforme G11]|uniref:Zinc-finger domain-containing protein n=1 Tax=Cronartium quercuum f. sp. fusiforme G11 TaxID=708437 RepID=A0A9P6NSG4_9BASI|nr:hypothetical protein CROQUDRAFT_651354 [Cronartium quercuum f. sp. fusiforme G11]
MPKAIRRQSDPRFHVVSQNQGSLPASSKRKSLDAIQPTPSSTLFNGFDRPATLQNSNAPRRKSMDNSTRKYIKSIDDSTLSFGIDGGPQRKDSISKKARQPSTNNHSSINKRHVSASEATSNVAKKPKLDILSKSGKMNNQTAILSKNLEPSNDKPTTIDETIKDRCHQCRSVISPEQVLICQNQKQPSKPKRTEKVGEGSTLEKSQSNASKVILIKCMAKYCAKCLRSRYGEILESIRPTIDSAYVWTCPMCMDYCNCSPCRKRKGLLPTGRLLKEVSQAGYSSARELLEADPNAQGADMISLANNKKLKKEMAEAPALPSKSTKIKNGKSQDKKPSSSKVTKPTKRKSSIVVAIPSPEKGIPSAPNRKEVKRPVQTKLPSSKLPAKTTETAAIAKRQVSASSDLTQPPSPQADPSEAQEKVVVPKIPTKRAPKFSMAPKSLPSIPTGDLSSEQIRSRLHVREFVCRFRSLLPGLGKTEQANSKNETQRVEKILDSMDDVVNFWIDDEGAMRAIMSSLVKLIISEIDEDDLESSTILNSPSSHATLTQLNKESRLGSVAPNPYQQSSCACWSTAQTFLTEEGLGDQLSGDIKNVYINDTPPTDDRIVRLKILPEQKLAVITGLIDVAFRGSILAEDLVQGLERERQAKADIVKERVKLNKQWQEDKTRLMAAMPPKETLLGPDAPTKGKQLQKLKEQEAERLRLLGEWELEWAQAESDHKNGLRMSSIAQYLAGSVNRIRFLPIGRDTRGNTYYILSSTPGRTYPNEASELAYAWSYNLLMHGSEPSDLVHLTNNELKKVDSDDQIDMLEGGQRDDNDQWMRISHPGEVRKLGAWIEYEARLISYNNQSESLIEPIDVLTSVSLDSINGNKAWKSVAALVEQINTFAEYLDLKITEAADEQIGKRAVKSRTAARAGL